MAHYKNSGKTIRISVNLLLETTSKRNHLHGFDASYNSGSVTRLGDFGNDFS